MKHLFVNAGAASAGGGLTYLRNFVTHLTRRGQVRATVLLSPQAMGALFAAGCHPDSSRIQFLQQRSRDSATRFWREQTEVPNLIRSSGADVLLSTGNIALRHSPVPQILLSRNALYTSEDFFRDLRARGDYRLWITEQGKRFLAKRSIAWADCTIAPSMAFAAQLKAWTGRDIIAVHHGFDGDAFFANEKIPAPLQAKLQAANGCVRLLFVSHYNYYRNFETLLRAVPLIRQQLAPVPVRLFLTCQLRSDLNPGSYRAHLAAALVRELGIGDEVIELGTVPYDLLHHIYQACDVYVTPAYAESFAHPLVEAMASGMPIVAADLPVHREICRGAALYAPVFSPAILAKRVVEVAKSPTLGRQLAESGRRRAQDFSWERHVERIIAIAEKLASAPSLQLPLPPASATDPAQLAS
jgi:glycosyltransferase involved in cell wall biosynthesis